METVPESDELPSEPTAPGGDVTIPATAVAEKTSPVTADVPAATVADAAAVGEKESEDEDVDLTEDKEDEQQPVGFVAVSVV